MREPAQVVGAGVGEDDGATQPEDEDGDESHEERRDQILREAEPILRIELLRPTDGHSSERRWSQSWPGAQVASGHAAVGATARRTLGRNVARRALGGAGGGGVAPRRAERASRPRREAAHVRMRPLRARHAARGARRHREPPRSARLADDAAARLWRRHRPRHARQARVAFNLVRVVGVGVAVGGLQPSDLA